MTDDILIRLRNIATLRGDMGGSIIPLACMDAIDEIKRLREELTRWAVTPPNRMVCSTHGTQLICFDDFLGGVYWCDACKHGDE